MHFFRAEDFTCPKPGLKGSTLDDTAATAVIMMAVGLLVLVRYRFTF